MKHTGCIGKYLFISIAYFLIYFNENCIPGTNYSHGITYDDYLDGYSLYSFE